MTVKIEITARLFDYAATVCRIDGWGIQYWKCPAVFSSRAELFEFVEEHLPEPRDKSGDVRVKIELKPPYRPLLNDEAVAFLESIVTPEFQVFEYGSGMSTIWLAQRVKHVISVENSLDWYSTVIQALAEFEPRLPVLPCIMPFALNTDNEHGVVLYVSAISVFSDESFNLVFVDGQARPWCIKAARCKVKPGGWMVLDDADWKPVKDALHMLADWEEVARFRGKVEGAIDGSVKTNTTAFYRKS